MPIVVPPPLSSTVSSVFDSFLKKLEANTILDENARAALAECLHGQKLDPESLRKAIFEPGAALK
jgi:hypothetical protein